MPFACLPLTPAALYPSMPTPPDRVTMVYGKVVSGNKASLALADGDRLVVQRFTVPNAPVWPVTFRIEANLPYVPTELGARVVAKAGNAGSYELALNLMDWTTGLFDPATNVTSNLGPESAETALIVQGDPARFVRAADRRVWVLTRVRAKGPTALQAWSVEVDLGHVLATPPFPVPTLRP